MDITESRAPGLRRGRPAPGPADTAGRGRSSPPPRASNTMPPGSWSRTKRPIPCLPSRATSPPCSLPTEAGEFALLLTKSTARPPRNPARAPLVGVRANTPIPSAAPLRLADDLTPGSDRRRWSGNLTGGILLQTIDLGATWLRRGLQNLGGMPRGRSPRKSNCNHYSCQRRQLRPGRLRPVSD